MPVYRRANNVDTGLVYVGFEAGSLVGPYSTSRWHKQTQLHCDWWIKDKAASMSRSSRTS